MARLPWDTALGEDRWAFAIYPLPLVYLKTVMREYIEIYEVLRSYNFQPNVPVDVAQGGLDVCIYVHIVSEFCWSLDELLRNSETWPSSLSARLCDTPLRRAAAY